MSTSFLIKNKGINKNNGKNPKVRIKYAATKMSTISLPNNPYTWVVFVEPTVTFIINPTYPDSISKSVELCDDANILCVVTMPHHQITDFH